MYTNKQIWSVSYPILLSLLAQNVINVTDTAFLGHVSEVALGASAMGGLFYICVFTIAFGFSTGSQIVIARRNGEGRYTDVGPVMIQGVMFLFAMALLLFGFTKAFGKKPLAVRRGGSIPIISTFEQVLGIKTILMGFGLESNAIHSPNENIPLDILRKGIEAVVEFHLNY